MSDDDSSSADDADYAPSKREIREADAEEKRLKRQKTAHGGGSEAIAEVRPSAKVDAIWQQLSGGGGAGKPRPAVSLAALSRPAARPGAVPAADKEWMRQLGISVKSGGGGAGGQQRRPLLPPVVAAPASAPSSSAAPAAPAVKEQPRSLDVGAAARALAAAKGALSSTAAATAGQVAITETRKFSGKEVQVSRMGTPVEAAAAAQRERERASRAGLDGVLASLNEPKKVTVLDKSRDDWGAFKGGDAAVAEELEAHGRSGGKYLDKVDFLKRAELAQYQAERDERLRGRG